MGDEFDAGAMVCPECQEGSSWDAWMETEMDERCQCPLCGAMCLYDDLEPGE